MHFGKNLNQEESESSEEDDSLDILKVNEDKKSIKKKNFDYIPPNNGVRQYIPFCNDIYVGKNWINVK